MANNCKFTLPLAFLDHTWRIFTTASANGKLCGMKLKNVLLLITPSSPGRFAGIARFARSHGWHLTVADRMTHALNGWTGDGALVTLRDDESTLAYVRGLRRRRIPVVDLTFARPDVSLPRVAGDNAAIGRAAAAHFATRYFRNAAWFSTGWGNQHELRFDAFAKALEFAPERWAWALDTQKTKADDWNSLSRWLVRRLAAAKRPLGVFCFDDADASRVESAAIAAGLSIPGDVAILGAGDDEPLCQSQMVPISSVRHDLESNGYAGAALLAKLMTGGKPPSAPLLIPPRGIAERASTDSLGIGTELVKRARDRYAADLANPPSTTQLAESLGVSRATLDRVFAADVGIAPAKLLARMRIDEAKRLMADDSRSLAEISTALGFCNPAYFCNSFRRATGLSPRAWRARESQ